MSKVLILSNDSGGLYRFRKELLEKICKKNTVIVATDYVDKMDDLIAIGCKLIRTKVDRRGHSIKNDVMLLCNYLSIIKKEKPDIILSFTIKPNLYGGLAARLSKIKYYTHVAGLGTPFQKNNVLTMLLSVMLRVALRDSETVFFENFETMNYYSSHKLISSKSVVLPGAGVNLEEYEYKPIGDSNRTTFIFIGRIMKEKGIEEFIKASKKLKEEFSMVRILVVGPCEEQYQSFLHKLNSIVEYYGLQSNIKPFVYESDCLVLPSYHEGMANVLLEAAAMGRILITTDISGCKEAVANNISGFLVNKGDAEDLYRAMRKVVLLNLSQRNEMGFQSRRIVEKFFDKEIVVQKILDELSV